MLCVLTANNNGELSNKVGDMFIPYDIDKIVRDWIGYNKLDKKNKDMIK